MCEIHPLLIEIQIVKLLHYMTALIGWPLCKYTRDKNNKDASGQWRCSVLWWWLSIGHSWKHHGAQTVACPCCNNPDETFKNLLLCRQPDLCAVRDEGATAFLWLGKEKKFQAGSCIAWWKSSIWQLIHVSLPLITRIITLSGGQLSLNGASRSHASSSLGLFLWNGSMQLMHALVWISPRCALNKSYPCCGITYVTSMGLLRWNQ